MPRWQRVYLAVCAALIGYGLACTLCDFGSFPRLIYLPHRRSWLLAARPPSPAAITYYGTVLWGAGGALVGGAAVWLLAGRARAPLARRWLHLAGGWAATAVGFALAYYLWSLRPW